MMQHVMTGAELSAVLVATVAARIDDAVAEVPDAYKVSARLALTEDEKRSPLGSAAMAFDYLLDGHDGQFGAIIERSDGVRYPPALEKITPEVSNVWLAVSQTVSTPLARARLNDLCFTGGWGNRGQSARIAAESYLTLAATPTGTDISDRAMDRVTWLGRALTLARKVRDRALADRVIAETVAAAREYLPNTAIPPGAVLGLLTVLADDADPPTDLAELLAEARDRYRGDAWNSAILIGLQIKHTGPESDVRAALQREAVQIWMDEAERTAGLNRMRHLETAIKLARDYGFAALGDEATARLQALSTEDLGLMSNTMRFSFPEEAVEAYLSAFTDASSWEASLAMLFLGGPPSGDASKNRELAEQTVDHAPLYALVPKIRLGGDGLPRFTASTEEQRSEWLLAQHEALGLRMRGGVIAEALRRVWSRWGPISQGDLAEFLGQRTHVGGPLATVLASGFVRHFTGDFEGAAYILTPKIEALVRSAALACGLPLYRTQRAKSPGQYPGLGALLPELKKVGLDESWYRFLHTFLSSVAGTNTRNELLHGFLDEITEPTSALVVVAALYLAVGIEATVTAGAGREADSGLSI